MKFDKPLLVFDIETFYDTFTFVGKFYQQPEIYSFEISPRKNEKENLLQFLEYLKQIDAYMVGYNNLNFDWPIVQELMVNPHSFDNYKSFKMAQQIIEAQKFNGGARPAGIQLHDRLIHQIDLMKIWHYDNEAKRCRLKDLQFVMRSPTVEDLPFDFRKPLSSEQTDLLISYNKHDVTETEKFLGFTMERIELRRDLIRNRIIKGDVLNWNDTKLGEMFFTTKLGLKGRVRGTDRLSVNFQDIILPKVQFRRESFNEVVETFKTKRWIKDDKDHNKTIPFSKHLGNLEFFFGSGGVHASVENKIYRSSETHKIIDIDVSGMYPAVGIANKFYPEHLGEKFVDVYRQLKIDRKQYPKGSAMNSVLKLAQNGVYGKSNSEYSAMFDIQYLFKITINGQLQLTQLAEMLLSIPCLELIQCNTDGITAHVPRQYEWLFEVWKKEWEHQTGLELEQAEYKSMHIANVSNYIAVDTKGKIKRKGLYWYATDWKEYDEGPGHWHKDLSQLVVPKVAEAVMLHGVNAEWYLRTMTDPFDFMLRQKIKGEQKGFIGGVETQKTVRYYVSKAGSDFKVIRPAAGPVGQYKRKNKLTDKFFDEVMKEIGPDVWDARIHTGNKSKYEDTESAVCKGFKVEDCCDASRFNWNNVDYDFYLAEIEKIVIRENK